MIKFIEEDIHQIFGEESESIIREIKIFLMTNNILGKKYFTKKDVGSGWLTKKRNGQLIFTPRIYNKRRK
tara:strand:+ start:359 stop:568 length:210 start_codon:yes stop_codon:yes gene_type:complete